MVDTLEQMAGRAMEEHRNGFTRPIEELWAGLEEEKPDKRPKCDWQITEKLSTGGTTTRKCDSEQGIFHVTGHGLHTGRKRESDICEKHILDAYKKWNVDSADRICG